jgi:hypothetical protein
MWEGHYGLSLQRDHEEVLMANKEQKKVQKAPPKSNKQKKEAQKEKKASKDSKSPLS